MRGRTPELLICLMKGHEEEKVLQAFGFLIKNDSLSYLEIRNNFRPTALRCCPWSKCCGMGDFRPRTVWLGHPEKREQRYPRNVINNQKYNFFTFLPGVRHLLYRFRHSIYTFVFHIFLNLSNLQRDFLKK